MKRARFFILFLGVILLSCATAHEALKNTSSTPYSENETISAEYRTVFQSFTLVLQKEHFIVDSGDYHAGLIKGHKWDETEWVSPERARMKIRTDVVFDLERVEDQKTKAKLQLVKRYKEAGGWQEAYVRKGSVYRTLWKELRAEVKKRQAQLTKQRQLYPRPKAPLSKPDRIY